MIPAVQNLQSLNDCVQPGLHRDYLFRFAMRRVGNRELADDLVQETLLAALQSSAKSTAKPDAAKATFHGRSTYRVWLAGILKHKMMDAMRERSRYVAFPTSEHDGEDIEIDPSLLKSDNEDAAMNDPRHACELSELLTHVSEGLEKLPKGVAEVFVAREIEGESTASIAARAGLSEANIWVRVHRARKALQGHLAACGAIEGMNDQHIRWAA